MIEPSKIKVNLNKRTYGAPLVINQYNRNVPYEFELIQENGSPYNPESTDIIKLEIVIGNTAIIKSTGFTVEGNKVSWMLDREMTLNSGQGTFNFVVENSNGLRVASFKTGIIVEANSIDENTVPEPILVTIKEELDSAITEATRVKEETDNLIKNGGAATKGEVYEIREEMAAEVVSRRLRGENNLNSPAGTFDSANFAGQGKTTGIPIGNVFHHYTDGKLMQIDNVGQNNVMITMVNANNPVRRPDKPSTFYGNGYYFQLMTNNPNTNEVYSHLVIDEKANLFWNGVSPSGGINVPTLTSAKDDGGYPAFLIKSSKNHQTLVRFENGNGIAQLLLNKTGNRSDIVSPSNTTDGLQVESKAGGIRLAPANGQVDLVNANVRKNYNGLWYSVYPTIYGTTANRPTDIAGKYGMPYFDMNLNKQIYVNNLGNGWIDAMGNPV